MNPARPQLVITFKFLKHLLFGILDLGFWDLGFLTFDIFDIFYIWHLWHVWHVWHFLHCFTFLTCLTFLTFGIWHVLTFDIFDILDFFWHYIWLRAQRKKKIFDVFDILDFFWHFWLFTLGRGTRLWRPKEPGGGGSSRNPGRAQADTAHRLL